MGTDWGREESTVRGAIAIAIGECVNCVGSCVEDASSSVSSSAPHISGLPSDMEVGANTADTWELDTSSCSLSLLSVEGGEFNFL